MGNKITTFSEAQLEAYQDCTFFAKKDILRIFRRFYALDPESVPYNINDEDCARIKLPMDTIQDIPELKANPFRVRICQVFSDDGTGNMSFNDFLNMFSVFSEAASRDIKAAYAFKIYNYDDDEYLGRSDLKKTLVALTRDELTADDVKFVVDKVLEETDFDGDEMLSYSEFEHVISKAPEFISTFHIRI